jgi:molybdopterin-binding protein
MKLSARNQLTGKMVEVSKGETTAHIRVEVPAGMIVTSSISNEAVDELNLHVGDQVTAVMRASDVMIAV